MGRIHVLPETVANKIAAGEVVERPASVVKELLENSLDAGATRIRLLVEAGGKRLIQVMDDGCGMLRDDALLAFERHATSKIHQAEDLLTIRSLGFRGEALPAIASVSRLQLKTRAEEEEVGTAVEIAGGHILSVADAGLPTGTSIAIRDLFFNTPARKKFLRSESTELSHIATLVTQYCLAHPEKHFELHSSTQALLVAPPVSSYSDRLFQVLGPRTLDEMIPVQESLAVDFGRGDNGGPEPSSGVDLPELWLHGFVSKPQVQKLNRNSIFVFVNRRLIRDRLLLHALSEAYRNILPGGLFPVALLFLEMPCSAVDCNVHPAKTEVRFRQSQIIHDFVRDSLRRALTKTRPVPEFLNEIRAHPTASPAFRPGPSNHPANNEDAFELHATEPLPAPGAFAFDGAFSTGAGSAASLRPAPDSGCGAVADMPVLPEQAEPSLEGLRPLGQIRNSFIVAASEAGLWIIDQHVAHERVLFERVLRQRSAGAVEMQRLLMPLIVELNPGQAAVFAELGEELCHNGFEMEPFGSRTLAITAAPAGVDAEQIERLLQEVLDELRREQQRHNLEAVRAQIAASIACHAAIKINTPLAIEKMEWLLAELSKTSCPFSCPHGRPVLLRYSSEDIQRAFKRI